MRIQASPGGVAHVPVQVLDADGKAVPTADDEIKFTLQGTGTFWALTTASLTATRVI